MSPDRDTSIATDTAGVPQDGAPLSASRGDLSGNASQPLPEYMTVPELAALLRLKERKIYDLAASGAVPCSRATGKLLFPAAEVRTWLARASTGGHLPRPRVLLGSHDPLLDWAVRTSGCGLAMLVDGSMDGLSRFAAQEGMATGLHIFDRDSATWNLSAAQQTCAEAAGGDAVLIGFARRARGLVTRADAGIATLGDLAGRRFVPRQPGAGSDVLYRHLAAEAGLAPDAVILGDIARTETEAVQAVARGEADAALGLASVARDFGLGFVPLIQERFDLLIDRRAYFDTPIQRLLGFCAETQFAMQAERMGGYDITPLGDVRWNG